VKVVYVYYGKVIYVLRGRLFQYGNMIGLQLTVEGLLFATYECVEKGVKCFGVVVVACVAQLVQDYEFTKLVGEKHYEYR
jgi:hypothetical protein